MTTLLVAAFLIVHGLLHPGVWTAPQQPGTPGPFVPGHSWALAAARVSPGTATAMAPALAWTTAVVYAIAGAGVLAGTGWWPTAALVAASTALLLKAVWFDLKAPWFDPWLSLSVLLDVGVVVAVAFTWPASVY